MDNLHCLDRKRLLGTTIPIGSLDRDFPDHLHEKMRYARNCIRQLAEGHQLSEAGWEILEKVAKDIPEFAMKLDLGRQGNETLQQRERISSNGSVIKIIQQSRSPKNIDLSGQSHKSAAQISTLRSRAERSELTKQDHDGLSPSRKSRDPDELLQYAASLSDLSEFTVISNRLGGIYGEFGDRLLAARIEVESRISSTTQKCEDEPTPQSSHLDSHRKASTLPSHNRLKRRASYSQPESVHFRARVWRVGDGIHNGISLGAHRHANDWRACFLEKQVATIIDGNISNLISVPFIRRRSEDLARNERFESSRNPTEYDIKEVAHELVTLIDQSGINCANIVVVPRRIRTDLRAEPMGKVALAIEQISGGRYKFVELLQRSALNPAPSRTSVHIKHPGQDESLVYSGLDDIVIKGQACQINRFAGDSNFIERLKEFRLGRNRTIGEDYGTLEIKIEGPEQRKKIILLDDSVNQAVSLIASALKLHNSFNGLEISPIAYWAFASAPLDPRLELYSRDSAADIIGKDDYLLGKAIESHYAHAQQFIERAFHYAGHAERAMREDPLGNWIGGLARGIIDFDQRKAWDYLGKFTQDQRLRTIAVKVAAKRVNCNDPGHEQLLLDQYLSLGRARLPHTVYC